MVITEITGRSFVFGLKMTAMGVVAPDVGSGVICVGGYESAPTVF